MKEEEDSFVDTTLNVLFHIIRAKFNRSIIYVIINRIKIMRVMCKKEQRLLKFCLSVHQTVFSKTKIIQRIIIKFSIVSVE